MIESFQENTETNEDEKTRHGAKLHNRIVAEYIRMQHYWENL